MEAKANTLLPHTTTEKITITLQNNHQPELSENLAGWKSNNKELQSYFSRHVVGAEAWRRGGGEWAVPHPCLVDKNPEGYLRSGESQPHIRPQSPGFQCQEDKSP